MTLTTPMTRRDLLTLSIVLVIAAFLRLNQIGVVSFQYDEALLSQRAMDMVATRTIPTLGIPSSAGLPNSPASVYVLAIPFALSDNPIVATAFIALLNVVGVGLLWLLARRYGTPTLAFVTSLIYAVSPWAILFSRKIWEQDFHTPFLLLAMLLGFYGFAESGDKRFRKLVQALCLPVFLFGLQIHFAAWALFPLFFWLLWLGRKRISRAALVISLGLGLLVMLPFAIGLTQAFDANPNSLSGLAHSATGSALTLKTTAITDTAEFATGVGLLSTETVPTAVANSLTPVTYLWVVIGLLTLSGIGGLLMPSLRHLSIFSILWVLLPVIVFTPSWTIVYEHYFIASIPMLALLAGIGAEFWLSRLERQGSLAFALSAIFFCILATQAIWWRNLIIDDDSTLMSSDFSTPLHDMIDVRAKLQPYKNVLVISDDYWSVYNQEPLSWTVLLRNSATCVRAIGNNGFAVFPQAPFAVLTTPRAGLKPVGNIYQSAASSVFPLRPGEGSYTIATFNQQLTWSGQPLVSIQPVKFDNGIELDGYTLLKKNLFLEWRIDRNSGEEFQYFAHFLDAQAQRLGQRDTRFIPGHYWCQGDQIISWTNIDLPDNLQTLRVGMYRIGLGREAGQFIASNVLNNDNQPVGQWVDIPLVKF